MKKNIILKSIFEKGGFYKGLNFKKNELSILRKIIKKKYLEIIKTTHPNMLRKFSAKSITDYHTLSRYIDHSNLWTKENRLFTATEVLKFKKLKFFKNLKKIFGENLKISNEEKLRKEEVYWRIVRPKNINDVGPLHADGWFWKLNNWLTPKNYFRLKMWIPIYNEKNNTGLVYVPNTHDKNIAYKSIKLHGKIKPVKPLLRRGIKKKSFNLFFQNQ